MDADDELVMNGKTYVIEQPSWLGKKFGYEPKLVEKQS